MLTLLYLKVTEQVLKIIILTQNAILSLLRLLGCKYLSSVRPSEDLCPYWPVRTEGKKFEMVVGFKEKGRGRR